VDSLLEKISLYERRVLQYLALGFEPLNATEFYLFLNRLDVKTAEGKALSANYASLLRKSLIHKGVLRETTAAWGKAAEFASPELAELLTREAVREEWFQEVAAQIQIEFPPDQHSHWLFGGARYGLRLLRDFRLQIYVDKQLSPRLAAEVDRRGLTDAANQILLGIFSNPFQPELLAEFDRETQTAILLGLFKNSLDNFVPTEELRKFVVDKNLDATDFVGFEINELIFRGEIAAAKKLIGEEPQNLPALLANGTIQLLEKDFAAAAESFETGIAAWRKSAGKRKGYPAIWQMFLYGLALYKADERRFYPFLEEFYAYAEKNYPHLSAHQILKALDYFFKNSESTAAGLLNRTTAPTLFGRISKIIAAALIPAAVLPASEIAEFGTKSRAAGFRWLEMEFQHLVAVKGKPDSLPTEAAKAAAAKLADELGFEPLGTVIKPLAEWERALKVLQAVADNLADGAGRQIAAQNETRVAWLIDFEERAVQPVEQKFSKSGWTTGRNIALKRLYQRDVKNLTEQDSRAVKAGLRREAGYYYGDEYYFKWENTIAELIGHPFLFSLQNPAVAVRLEAGEATLVVKDAGKELELSFDTKFTDEGIVLQKETETRWKAIKISKHHIDVAAVLQRKKLKIPAEGRAALVKAIQPLSAKIAVASDLEEHFENLPQVPADSRIHALITPRGDGGFHLEFFVKPFGTIPPYFKPGKSQETVIAELEGVRTRTKRDLARERQLLNEVEEICPTLAADENPNYEWELANDEACLNALLEMEKPRESGILVIEWTKGQKLKLLGAVDFDNFRLSVKGKNEWFEVSGEARVSEHLVLSMQELNRALTQGSTNFIELSDGQFLAVTEKLRKRLQTLAAATDDKGRLHNLRAAPVLEDFADELVHFKADKAWQAHLAKIESIRNFKPVVPPTFEADLRPYQIEGYEWLARLAKWGVGACLADDMGLGKTLQTLAVLVERAELGAALVVAPVSVCRNWVREAVRFAPTLNFQLFGAGDRQSAVEQLNKYDVLVTSYNLLQAEAELFTSRSFATIVLDEAQMVKNRATKRSQTVMNLQGDFRIITTGTPIENHTGELWNLFNFINPGLLGSHDFFTARFAVPIEKNKDEAARRSLQKLIQPFVLRRRKNQVLNDLPAKTEIVLTVEMSAEERAFYEAVRRDALEKIESEAGAAADKRFRILAELTRLRLACCHPRLVNENAAVGNGKLDLFGEVLDELLENKHKALVFSQFVKHLRLVEEYLQRRGIKYQYLDGSIAAQVRQERIDAFQRGTGGEIFLISLKAGGTGLNLTAADYVIHLDPWWNPAVEDQATDRAHRIGQQRPVTVYRLVTENTVEEKILKLHETKRDLADTLLAGADASGKLSAEDLLNLIKTS
jgi:SNF2 family DNA or RNA helicase